MNSKNVAKLKKKFPKLLKKIDNISCGDGWYNLILRAFHEVSAVSEDVYILQAKEKFASFIFHFDGELDDEKEALLQIRMKFHRESSTICEETGGIGCLHVRGGNFKTLCPLSAILLGYTKAPNDHYLNNRSNT